MGFWNNALKIVSAPAAGLADVLGGEAGRTTTGTQTSTTTQSGTRGVDLREQTEAERQLQEQSMQGLIDASAQMTPEQLAARRQESYNALFNPAAANIQQGYQRLGAQQYANAASRGLAGSSRGEDQELLNRSSQGRELGQASQQATLGARQLEATDEAQRIARAAEMRAAVNDLWRNRLASSTITTTGQSDSKGTTTSVAPDTYWSDMFDMGGKILGSM